MAGLGSELFNLATSYDPAGAMRKADVEYQQYGLQQQALQQAQQDQAQQATQAKGLGTITGTTPGIFPPGIKSPQQGLGQMAGNMLGPQYKLTTPDGELTSAGLVNQTLITAQTDQQQAQAKAKEANFLKAMGKTSEAQVADMEARRYLDKAQKTQQEAQKLKTEARDDFVSTLYGAKSQEDYDRRLKDALERTGIEPPKDFPATWSPDMKEKLLSKMSPTMRAKIEKEDRAETAAKHKEKMDNLREQRLEALLRGGGAVGGPSKVYDTLEEKVSDPSYGVAKGKVPAKEQTVARRITLDSKEVTQGIDQVLTLTEGGMKDTTGTTFANVKDTGLLTAPAKFFTNTISNKDSAMYDAMMYPLVKGLSLYTNPDYRPTDNDVKIAMNAYKAQAGQPQAVQLEKMAELKKNYLSAAESFLDSSILNPQQANSLKQQIKYIEKAIPWDVKDVVNFTRQKEDKDFKQYLSKKGKQTVDPTKPSETKPSQIKPTPTADDIALAKSSPELAAKFEAHFGVKP